MQRTFGSKWLMMLAATLLLAGPAVAAPITVGNASFELPDIGPDGNGATFSAAVDAPWVSLEYNNNGILILDNSEASSPDTTAGTQYAVITNRSANHTTGQVTQLTQVIYDGSSTGLTEGVTYTLSLQLREILPATYGAVEDSDFVFGLYADAAMTTPYATLAGQDMTTPISDTQWQGYSVQFTASAAQAGGALYIGIENHDPGSGTTVASAPRLGIDDVQLDAAIAGLHPGDANGDGLVNLADLQILGDNWQSTTASWGEADCTGDGNGNLADLQSLGDNWGYGVSPDMSFDKAVNTVGIVIPEPMSAGLLGMGLAFLALRRCAGR